MLKRQLLELTGTIYVSLVGLPDLNGNGSPELGVVRTLADNRADVFIRDSATRQAVSTVNFFESGLESVDLAAVPDISGKGHPEFAALFRHPGGPASVQLKDAATGREIGSLRFFGKDRDAMAVTAIDRGWAGRSSPSSGSGRTTPGRHTGRPAVGGTATGFISRWIRRASIAISPCSRTATATASPRWPAYYPRRWDGQCRHHGRCDQGKDQHYPFCGYPAARRRRRRHRTALPGSVTFPATDRRMSPCCSGRQTVRRRGVRDASRDGGFTKCSFSARPGNVVAVTGLDSNGDGVSDIAVLGVRDDGTVAAVQVRDARADRH